MNERDSWTVEAMEKYGGSFVKCLAALARHADAPNLMLIRTTWQAYWYEYEQLGRKMEKEQA